MHFTKLFVHLTLHSAFNYLTPGAADTILQALSAFNHLTVGAADIILQALSAVNHLTVGAADTINRH